MDFLFLLGVVTALGIIMNAVKNNHRYPHDSHRYNSGHPARHGRGYDYRDDYDRYPEPHERHNHYHNDRYHYRYDDRYDPYRERREDKPFWSEIIGIATIFCLLAFVLNYANKQESGAAKDAKEGIEAPKPSPSRPLQDYFEPVETYSGPSGSGG